jgi:penicillin-binding protein 2
MTDKVENMPRWRLLILALLTIASLGLLASRLHTLQVRESGDYASSQLRQSVRRVLLPAPRGRIFDRNGEILADNRPSYCIAVYVEELRQPGTWSNTVNAVEARLDEISASLGVPRQITRSDIRRHISKRLPLPLLAWQDVDDRSLARFAEEFANNPGMDIYVQPERIYPHGALAAHILGYVGREKPAETNEVFHYNVLGMKGRAGIEASMDSVLAGEPGGKLITVDVSGYRHGETISRPSKPGRDIHLTIDAGLQAELERLIGGRRGAAVAVDPRDGEILALASEPAFDPNALSPSVPPALWRALMADKDRPLLNRAISGAYPPGSVFKPCVALAALEAGVSPNVSYSCNGVFTLGNMHLRCSSTYGHGENLSLRYAIEQSCNPFFCSLGTHIGIEAIDSFAAKMGFGRRTGIPLGGEREGLLPTPEWKSRVRHDGWRAGDTANLSIGQGLLLATPLQIAMYAAALANGGTLHRPRLVADDESMHNAQCAMHNADAQFATNATNKRTNEQTNKRTSDSAAYGIVRGGMYDVVNAPRGTGRRAKVPGLKVAAKTGTAEYGSRSNRRKHTWMIAFAPFDNPTIALAILIEDGDSGGRTVAPLIRAALAYWFGLPDPGDETESPESPEGLEGLEGPENLEGLERPLAKNDYF